MKLKMKNLNLLEACSIMGDALALRMALVSNREAMSSLMPLRNCLTLLRAKLPWFRILRAIFYILLIILSTKLGEFMLINLILFLIMLLCIRMRHLALGILHTLTCLKRKLLLHEMIIISFKTFDASYVLTNKSGKIVAKYIGGNTRDQRLVFGYPRCLFLTSKDPRLFGYLRTRPKLFCRFMHAGAQVG
jgi:hypothetical protein